MTEYVMEYVRQSVLNGEMDTKEWYSVYRLADELGVSRSPCRDALLKLEETGLIRFVKNRGFKVNETTAEDVAQDFALRLGIEPPAAYRAAALMDNTELQRIQSIHKELYKAAEDNQAQVFFQWDLAFHDVILLAGKTPRGRRIVDQIRNNTRLLGVGTHKGARSLEDICIEHEPIVTALLDGDCQAARQGMKDHLHTSGCFLVRQAYERSHSDLSPEEIQKQTQKIWNAHTIGL